MFCLEGQFLFLIVWCRGDRRNILQCELSFVLPVLSGAGWEGGGGRLRVSPASERKTFLCSSLVPARSALAVVPLEDTGLSS